VQRLQAHPGEGGQQRVVQQGRRGHAQADPVERGQPGVEQVQQVQRQQRRREVDQDLGRVIPTQLSTYTYRRGGGGAEGGRGSS